LSRTWKQTLEFIEADTAPFSYKRHKLLGVWAWATKDLNYYRIRFCVHLRKLEFYNDKPLLVLLKFWHKYQKNRIGRMFSWEIPSNVCDKGLHLWHANVVINDCARIGKNALFHGNNCIGRKNDTPEGNVTATIGDNFNLGVGANVIGKVVLGDNVTVGANSLVVKSEIEGNCTLVGIPAHRINT